MKLLTTFCLATALFMTGCATVQTAPMTVPGIEKSSSVVVEDLRPASEMKDELFSSMIFSEAYGISRFAERDANPTGMRLLSHRAYEAFPELSKSAFKVHHFVSYMNAAAAYRKIAAGAALGFLSGQGGNVAVGAQAGANAASAKLSDKADPAVAKAGEVFTTQIDGAVFQKTADKEHQRAFYTPADNPSKATALRVIYIETEIMGKRIASRSIVPPLTGKPQVTHAEVLDICIANHLALYKNN
jgi:hypothetical protein